MSDAVASELPPLSRALRPWYLALLVLQAALAFVRWRILGDVHGALLMVVVVAVGLLAAFVNGVGANNAGIDVVYAGYYGLMAFVSGILDLNVAVEKLVWGSWHKKLVTKGDYSSIVAPLIYLLCASAQFIGAFVSYALYKDAELPDELEVEAPLFATQEQARIYNAVMSHSDRRGREQAESVSMLKPFAGQPQKLP